MQFNKNIILKDYFLRLSLNQKLIAMMLLLSLSIITIFVMLYSKQSRTSSGNSKSVPLSCQRPSRLQLKRSPAAELRM